MHQQVVPNLDLLEAQTLRKHVRLAGGFLRDRESRVDLILVDAWSDCWRTLKSFASRNAAHRQIACDQWLSRRVNSEHNCRAFDGGEADLPFRSPRRIAGPPFSQPACQHTSTDRAGNTRSHDNAGRPHSSLRSRVVVGFGGLEGGRFCCWIS
jgi:hypothetical protein